MYVMVYLSQVEFAKFLAGSSCEGLLIPALPEQFICALVPREKLKVHSRKALLGSTQVVVIAGDQDQ